MTDDAEGGRRALAQPGWRHVEHTRLDDFTAADWALLERQREPYMREHIARQALAMLQAQSDDPSFGYQINNYEHCLQAATLVLRDGGDDEAIVVALFHDLGFVTCGDNHGNFAAALLRPYVSPRHLWMLERHMYFLAPHCATHAGADASVLERWRGHPDFEFTANWVRRYDTTSIDAAYDTAPMAEFEGCVQRVFARPPRPLAPPERD